MSASASSIVDGGAPVVAAASAPVGGVSAAQSGSGSSGKGCSVCQRVLHSSAFSATQARAPAKSRKCMECVVNGQAGVVATEAAAAPAASATAAPQADNKKAKAKTNTTGPRVAGRQGGIVFSKDDDDAAIDAMLAQLSRPLKKGTVPPSAAKLAAEAAKPKKSAASSSSSSASSASSASSTKLPLMDEDDEWFLPEAESALEQVFRRFASIPSVGAPADTPRDDLAWAIADIQSFARATNGKEFSTEELVDIQENLDHDEEGRLTCQGFLDFYHLQTSSHPDETWKDLKKLGFNDQLQLQTKA